MYLSVIFGLVFSYVIYYGYLGDIYSIAAIFVGVQMILYTHGHNDTQYMFTLDLLGLLVYTLATHKDTTLQVAIISWVSIIYFNTHILIIYQLFLTPVVILRNTNYL